MTSEFFSIFFFGVEVEVFQKTSKTHFVFFLSPHKKQLTTPGAKYAVWSPDGGRVALLCKHAVVLAGKYLIFFFSRGHSLSLSLCSTPGFSFFLFLFMNTQRRLEGKRKPVLSPSILPPPQRLTSPSRKKKTKKKKNSSTRLQARRRRDGPRDDPGQVRRLGRRGQRAAVLDAQPRQVRAPRRRRRRREDAGRPAVPAGGFREGEFFF